MSTNDCHEKTTHGRIVVTVTDADRAVVGATIGLYKFPDAVKKASTFDCDKWQPHPGQLLDSAETTADNPDDPRARAVFAGLRPGLYVVAYEHLPKPTPFAQCIEVTPGCSAPVVFDLNTGIKLEIRYLNDDCTPVCRPPREGDLEEAKLTATAGKLPKDVELIGPADAVKTSDPNTLMRSVSAGSNLADYTVAFHPNTQLLAARPGTANALMTFPSSLQSSVLPSVGPSVTGSISLRRTASAETTDVAHWQAILNSTDALSFNQYFKFMELVFCKETPGGLLPFEQKRFRLKVDEARRLVTRRTLPFIDTDAYRYVKVATEAFVMVNCAIMAAPAAFDTRSDQAYFARRDVPFPTNGLDGVFAKDYLQPFTGGRSLPTLPYLAVIRKKLGDIDINFGDVDDFPASRTNECYGILQEKLTNPCLLELIWSYWHEEGMLVQTANAITRRFQNVRGSAAQDPLANLEIDPLRPLNNLLWGYVQDEQHRLSVIRRNYEYRHQYGIQLDGKAVQGMTPADTRSKFLEAFHNLLRLCTTFFKQDDDTTIKADAFPVLNGLKEVHLILTEGQHNQFGDLTSTARIEMMMQQWLLARPEFREFLPTRISVAYPEPWMDRVDAMKKLQGWTDTSCLHFRNLALFGEQILLGIRWGFWSDVFEPEQAFNWARLFRPQIQGYIHAYRAVAGVDLSAETADAQVDATMPSTLLRRRLTAQQQRGA